MRIHLLTPPPSDPSHSSSNPSDWWSVQQHALTAANARRERVKQDEAKWFLVAMLVFGTIMGAFFFNPGGTLIPDHSNVDAACTNADAEVQQAFFGESFVFVHLWPCCGFFALRRTETSITTPQRSYISRASTLGSLCHMPGRSTRLSTSASIRSVGRNGAILGRFLRAGRNANGSERNGGCTGRGPIRANWQRCWVLPFWSRRPRWSWDGDCSAASRMKSCASTAPLPSVPGHVSTSCLTSLCYATCRSLTGDLGGDSSNTQGR